MKVHRDTDEHEHQKGTVQRRDGDELPGASGQKGGRPDISEERHDDTRAEKEKWCRKGENATARQHPRHDRTNHIEADFHLDGPDNTIDSVDWNDRPEPRDRVRCDMPG